MDKNKLKELKNLLNFVANQIKIDEKYLHLNDDMINAKYKQHKNQYKKLQDEIKELKGE